VFLALFLFVLPMPYHTNAEGVVWLPEQAVVRARAAGFIERVAGVPGSALAAGNTVLLCTDPTLAANLRAQAARVEEVRARYDAAWGVRPAQAGQLEEEMRREEASLERIREEEKLLTVRAQAAGTLLMEQPGDLPGRFLKKGDVVGYVVGEYQPLVRLVVPQSVVDQVRLSTRAIEIKLPQQMSATWPARLIRAVPKAGRDLPSPALGRSGGGAIAVDPQDSHGMKSLESLFEFDLELPTEVPGKFIGSRVHVRFEHAPEAVGLRAWRALRRLFLSQFQV
jgi:putative peptide zinc metalloprotease protein